MAEERTFDMAALAAEQHKTTKIASIMQAIAGVPIFTGRGADLEFFIRRMDVIVLQCDQNPLDPVTSQYVLGYFVSRIEVEVLQEIGASWDTTWDVMKKLLREKYGGSGSTIPRLILREVLLDRDPAQGTGDYARTVLTGVRKVKSLIQDSGISEEEARIRTLMLEELAVECIHANMTRRVKQWVQIHRPTTLEALVNTVLEEEREDRDERNRRVSRRIVVPEKDSWRDTNNRVRSRPSTSWQVVSRDRRDRRPFAPARPAPARGDSNRDAERRRRREPVRREAGPRGRQCWECQEEGHLARDCPYMYRRDARRGNRDEPMDINTTRRIRVRSRADSGSDTETSSGGSASDRTGQSVRSQSWADRVKRRPNVPSKKGPSRSE